jgi:hypothetical protein
MRSLYVSVAGFELNLRGEIDDEYNLDQLGFNLLYLQALSCPEFYSSP